MYIPIYIAILAQARSHRVQQIIASAQACPPPHKIRKGSQRIGWVVLSQDDDNPITHIPAACGHRWPRLMQEVGGFDAAFWW